MEYLLQVKLGALAGLLFFTVLFGSVPARLRWFRTASGTEIHGAVLSLMSCLAGGVFLATCFLDVIPDFLSDIGQELQSQRLETDFPLPEFIMACGFFLVLILEKIVLHFTGHKTDEHSPLLPPGGHGHGTAGHLQGAPPHTHMDAQAHSSFRSFMLFLSLSLHSIFEGLAIGLQTLDSKVMEICIAIVLHKSIIVFSLSLKLVQSAVKPLWVSAYVGMFALMSPLGIVVGIAVMESHLSSGALIQAVLEGLAAGSFIYITFLEILPHELNSPERQLPKVIFILLGFSIMTGLAFLD
ncbi:zinc transporter ZIP1-like [Brienomyrus brachyistius]|uniref:zinc transporter ZIP1-like n=1 Tax=Brienomyrus brachyistius TaxID=42636 RepID=UPI0020B19482|nr:zinc transporter ZIP1-like [Brienomyrus brachyistius]